MWPAPLVTLMLPQCSMVDSLAARAMHPAAVQLCIQRVQDIGIDRADLLLANERQDVFIDQAAVRVGHIDPQPRLLEVAVEQLRDRGVGPGVSPLIDLSEESRPDLLGLAGGLRSRPDRFAQVMIAAGNGIDPGEDTHTKGPAR